MGESVASRLSSSGIDFRDISFSFMLPANYVLKESDWDATVKTGEQMTRVSLTITRSQLQIRFSPRLIINPCFFYSWVSLAGIDYTFASGPLLLGWKATRVDPGITDIQIFDKPSFFADPSDKITKAVTQWFNDFLSSTPFASGYNPLYDKDIQGNLQKLAGGMATGRSSSPKVLGDLTGLDAEKRRREAWRFLAGQISL
jgi:hypothetical protein